MRGVPEATKVAEAVTVPVNNPWQMRSNKTVSTFFTRPIRPTIRLPAAIALSIMVLRPHLSASMPQIGAMIPSSRLGAAVSRPTQKRSSVAEVTPSS